MLIRTFDDGFIHRVPEGLVPIARRQLHEGARQVVLIELA